MTSISLFCFPYAGSSASAYRKWKRFLNPAVELHPIELAGRGTRIDEPLYDCFDDAVDDAFRLLVRELDGRPFFFWGHSMGGLIGYELYYKLAEQRMNTPRSLIVSGTRAPHIPHDDMNFHDLPDSEFKQKMREFGGTPEMLFQDEALMNLFLPILRHDFRISYHYLHSSGRETMNCDLDILYGLSDGMAPPHTITPWKSYTSGESRFHEFRGNHFFIHDHVLEVSGVVNLTARKIGDLKR